MKLQRSLVAMALSVVPVMAAAEPGWRSYSIPETGAVVDIPTDVFTEDAGKPSSGYGRRFHTADGRANLTVQSVRNDAGDSPASYLAKQHPPANVEYKRVTSRFFAVSSTRNGTMWYDRCNFAGGYINCILINYPASEKRQWDRLVTRVSLTLASR